MLKTSASQQYTTANKLDDSEGTISGGVDVDDFRKSNKKLSKSKKSTISNNGGATKEPKFLNSSIRDAFNLLQQAFIKASIFWHFDVECYMWIETDISSYAIGGILS